MERESSAELRNATSGEKEKEEGIQKAYWKECVRETERKEERLRDEIES